MTIVCPFDCNNTNESHTYGFTQRVPDAVKAVSISSPCASFTFSACVFLSSKEQACDKDQMARSPLSTGNIPCAVVKIARFSSRRSGPQAWCLFSALHGGPRRTCHDAHVAVGQAPSTSTITSVGLSRWRETLLERSPRWELAYSRESRYGAVAKSSCTGSG